MKKLNKILIAAIFVFGFSSFLTFAQQITKFGVVDTSKVYSAYFRNSAPIRNYEKKKSEFQDEIDKRTEELRQLQQKKLDYGK
ncbi:MAG: OmpH family outer membrane protein, partial [Treponema sp.]|nr:OmpH family outer membrane protein [Treponema sp.]